MHYIGKSYVTTVYKCDNRLRRAVIREYMGQIFSDEAPKKRDKCIEMHYIGKSYVTTVYKCDNRLRRAVIREYMGHYFLM